MLHIYYGGTFDPIHLGHLAIARAARDELQSPVRLMPAADPPHRAPPGAAAGHRARMVELAIADEAGLEIDLRELRRAEQAPQSRSYSVDTLRELRIERGPQASIALLIGADSLIGLPSWREWKSLFELTHFVVAERPGSPLDADLPPQLAQAVAGRWSDDVAALMQSPAGRVFRLRQPLQAESASEVRHRIAAGRDWQALVPVAVANYICGHRLYLTPASRPTPL